MAYLSEDEHKKLLLKLVPTENLSQAETRFNSISVAATVAFEGSDFWLQLNANQKTWNDTYFASHESCHLFPEGYNPEVITKSFESLLNKVYRKNVIKNPKWKKTNVNASSGWLNQPNLNRQKPVGGWVTQDNWYEEINDIVRTQLIVKYMDGVKFLADELSQLADSLGLKNRVDFESELEGYYAAHFYIEFPITIPVLNFKTKRIKMSVEIQITTEIQNVIRLFTHKRYALARNNDVIDVDWMWNSEDINFKLNYLAHILHYVEGMILEIRDNQSPVKLQKNLDVNKNPMKGKLA